MKRATASKRTQSLIDGEFPLTKEDFQHIAGIAMSDAGIDLNEAKASLVYSRLTKRLRALRLESFHSYCALLAREEGGEERQHMVAALTTNVTRFFREQHHFEHVKTHVIEPLVATARAGGAVRIWSAACSSGEEPYSIAMVLREAGASLAGWDVKLLATDLDSAVLAHGAAGIYAQERFEAVKRQRVERFFDNGSGSQAGKLRAREELRSLITFRQLNLMHSWPMRGPFDAIFCRNVIIYFDKPTQRVLFERMAALQKPGDFLFLGHSESLYRVSDRYELVGRTTYRRLDN